MDPLNMIDARRVMPAAVFKWQILVILVSVAISGWLVLYLFDVNLTTKLVPNLITYVFIIHDAIYILYVIRCRWLIETSVHRSQVRESTVIFRFNCASSLAFKVLSSLFTHHSHIQSVLLCERWRGTDDLWEKLIKWGIDKMNCIYWRKRLMGDIQ
jgi:hypothetical protein